MAMLQLEVADTQSHDWLYAYTHSAQGERMWTMRVFSIWILQFLATQTYVSAQPGFLSLDCGASEAHTDDLGIEWTPDDSYIQTGIKTPISSALRRTSFEFLKNVRYFPQRFRKHCYTLPVLINEKYLLRTRFYYGNYDGLESSTVSFDILIGANNIMEASIPGDTESYCEFVVKAENSSLDLCLATNSNSPANVPYISTIEVRKLDPDMCANLTDSREMLIMLRRINLGAISEDDIRYPQDVYDRIWRSDLNFQNMGNYQRISSNSTVSDGGTFDKAPSAVMQTAIMSDSTMLFSFPVDLEETYYYYNFYFAEFTALGNKTREFQAFVNVSSVQTALFTINGAKDMEAPLISLEMGNIDPLKFSPSTIFSFVSTESSTLGPILNAAELFEYIERLSPGTEPDDIRAIRELMSYFNISGWSGDPCLPLPYTWNWITCDTAVTPARITELNLSNMQLRGTIPNSIASLVHLTKIYLDNNTLHGPVPDLSSLKDLTVLSLQNNAFDCIPPDPRFSYNTTAKFCEKKKDSKIVIAIAVACGSALLIGVGVLCIFLFRKKKKNMLNIQVKNNLFSTENPALAPKAPNLNSKSFSYKDVSKATNNFKRMLGEGGFGPVYFGRLSNGVKVAVKVQSSGSSQGHKAFNAEIDILSVVHHKNVVSFLGYCNEGPTLMLIYEFLSNGTLREHLYGTKYPPLSWKTRLGIALDAAQGLEYLHTACNLHIIHRDVKTTNILLSSTMVAKISDFGLSKLYDKKNKTHVSTMVKGTLGYLDPEYHSYRRLTEKSDVYSFGVVLLEIFCGREPINDALPEEEVVLSRWACKELARGNLKNVLDPKLKAYDEQAAWKVLELAMKCVEYASDQRPDMSTVVSELREALNPEDDEGFLTKSMDMESFIRLR